VRVTCRHHSWFFPLCQILQQFYPTNIIGRHQPHPQHLHPFDLSLHYPILPSLTPLSQLRPCKAQQGLPTLSVAGQPAPRTRWRVCVPQPRERSLRERLRLIFNFVRPARRPRRCRHYLSLQLFNHLLTFPHSHFHTSHRVSTPYPLRGRNCGTALFKATIGLQ